MDAGEPFRLRRALLCAALWCAIVTVVESIDEPVGQMRLQEQISFIVLVGSTYLVPSLIWSLGAELPASRRHPLLASIMLLPTATAASIPILLMLCPLLGHSSSMAEILLRSPTLELVGHVFWANLFYGGMFAAAYHFTQHNLQLRRRLAALRLVLGESEMRLREARLHRLHEQLQPATLVQALHALQKHYAQDPATGDHLFDALVAFLRAAMPGVRRDPRAGPTGMSLIEGYAGLRNAIDPTVLRWSVTQVALLDTASPAPPRLLAVLDRIDGAVPEGRTIELAAWGSGEEYAVRIRTAVEPEPSELCRLLEALQELDARAVGRCVTGASLEIVLRLPSASDCPLTPEHNRQQLEGDKHVADLA